MSETIIFNTFATVKIAGVYALLTALMIQWFSAFVILLNYELNTVAITEAFCENKDEPQLECNGKCHLAKEIKKEEKKKSELPVNINEFLSVVLDVHEPAELQLVDTPDPRIKHQSRYIEAETALYLSGIFHPPRV